MPPNPDFGVKQLFSFRSTIAIENLLLLFYCFIKREPNERIGKYKYFNECTFDCFTIIFRLWLDSCLGPCLPEWGSLKSENWSIFFLCTISLREDHSLKYLIFFLKKRFQSNANYIGMKNSYQLRKLVVRQRNEVAGIENGWSRFIMQSAVAACWTSILRKKTAFNCNLSWEIFSHSWFSFATGWTNFLSATILLLHNHTKCIVKCNIFFELDFNNFHHTKLVKVFFFFA